MKHFNDNGSCPLVITVDATWTTMYDMQNQEQNILATLTYSPHNNQLYLVVKNHLLRFKRSNQPTALLFSLLIGDVN